MKGDICMAWVVTLIGIRICIKIGEKWSKTYNINYNICNIIIL
jgi:hypothetical protein